MVVVIGRLHLPDASTRAFTRSAVVFCSGRLREDRRAVLRADVVALTVERGRVVQLEEPLLEQVFVAEHRRVERHADRLGVTRLAVVGVVVGRILQPAAGVANVGIDHAGHIAEDVLDAPEAAAREHGDFRLPRGGGASLSILLGHIILLNPAGRVDRRSPSGDRDRHAGASSYGFMLANDGRSDRNPARSSSEKSCGCSQAAKCPPLARALKWMRLW